MENRTASGVIKGLPIALVMSVALWLPVLAGLQACLHIHL